MPVCLSISLPGCLRPFCLARRGRRLAGIVPLAFLLLAAAPLPAAAPLEKARQRVEWGDWNEARALLAAALQAEPQNPQLLAYDAHILLAFGEKRQAVALAKKAVSLAPGCGTCHLFLAEGLGDRAKGLSRFHALFLLPKIRRQLHLAMKYSPRNPDVYWGFINYYLQVPPSVGGGAPKAQVYVRSLARYDAVDGAIALGEVNIAAGHPQRAMTAYQQAAAAHPRDPRALFAMGEELFRRGAFAQAAPWLEQARRLEPRSAFYTGYEAAALVHLNQQQRAWRLVRAFNARPQRSRLPDYLVAKALKSVGQNYSWARQLLESYLAAPREPDQPSHRAARSLLASLS